MVRVLQLGKIINKIQLQKLIRIKEGKNSTRHSSGPVSSRLCHRNPDSTTSVTLSTSAPTSSSTRTKNDQKLRNLLPLWRKSNTSTPITEREHEPSRSSKKGKPLCQSLKFKLQWKEADLLMRRNRLSSGKKKAYSPNFAGKKKAQSPNEAGRDQP